jgi:hypothetical protein
MGVDTLVRQMRGRAIDPPVRYSYAFLVEDLLRHLLVQTADQDDCPPQVPPHQTHLSDILDGVHSTNGSPG